MEAKHRVSSNMPSIFGMFLFISGIAGFGYAVWMAVSNNGGLLHWLSFLVGFVCIPVTGLGYFLMGEKERQESAKETKISKDQFRQIARHEFVRTQACIFGLVLFLGSVTLIVYALTWFMWRVSNKEDFALFVPIVLAIASVPILCGLLLLWWVFRDGKVKQKRVSKG